MEPGASLCAILYSASKLVLASYLLGPLADWVAPWKVYSLPINLLVYEGQYEESAVLSRVPVLDVCSPICGIEFLLGFRQLLSALVRLYQVSRPR